MSSQDPHSQQQLSQQQYSQQHCSQQQSSQQQQLSQQQQPTSTSTKPRWVPIECDPEVFQEAIELYGVPDTTITEVYSEELFDMVPQPIEALMMLYPSGCDEIQDFIDRTFPINTTHPDIFHIPQRVSNACGTYALLHAFINLRDGDELKEDSPFSTLWYQLASNPQATPDEKFQWFLDNTEIAKIHHKYAEEGQTDKSNYVHTDVHYITLFHKHGHLWILDGGRDGPLDAGECGPDEVLKKAYDIGKQIHASWGKETDFAMLAATRGD